MKICFCFCSGRSHLSKYTNTTSSYLVHNTSLPGNRQTELLTIASPTTDSDQLESTHIPVPAIVVPVIFVTMILVIGIFLLRWRRYCRFFIIITKGHFENYYLIYRGSYTSGHFI